MRVALALTVQPRTGRIRFFNYSSDVAQLPRVGDTVAVARYPNATADSSPITAQVTAVQWTDLRFGTAIVYLNSDEPAISLTTLLDAGNWVDEDPD